MTDLGEKYRLIAELGQGGMATVYLAVMLGTGGFRRLAVVKVLRSELAQDSEFVQMFLDEAKLCARLAHPSIVHTYDVGASELGHFIAMEYLDGVSLHAAIARLARNSKQFKFPMQARVLLDVLEGLRYAHELSDYDGRKLEIVHRDVTPQNIFVTYEGQVKLLDFGIAKTTASSVKTATGVVKGKLLYMAPEQARGEHVDARADLYAVGVMLWEALTGRRRMPTGLTEPALFARLISGEPPEVPDAAAQGFPPQLDAVIMKALATRREDRYQSASEFHDALELVLRTLPPVNLRDLGNLLAESFAENRERIRTVIEDQFRLIDAGQTLSTPELPAVRHNGIPATRYMSGRVEKTPEPRSRVTISESRRAPAPAEPRKRLMLGIAGAIAASLIAIPLMILSRSVTHADTGLPSASAGLPAAGAAPESSVAAPPSSAGEPAPLVEAPLPAESGGRVTRTRLSANPATPRTSIAHTAGAQPPSTSATPPMAPPSTPEPIPVRRPEAKPKVQLERDNPWR